MTAERLWMPRVSREVRAAFEPHLDRWDYLLPTWCHELVLDWQPVDTGAHLETTVASEYRWSRIVIYPSWLGQVDLERSNSVRHEIVHSLLDPLMMLVHNLLEQVKGTEAGGSAVFKWATEQRRLAMEAVVCDITRALR